MDTPTYFSEAFVGPGKDVGVAAALLGKSFAESADGLCAEMKDLNPDAYPVII